LVYTVRDEALLLVAVFHARRRPGYWLERLNQSGRRSTDLALPSGCHEAAVRAGTARDEEGDGGIKVLEESQAGAR
jgi:hypothetical protein